MWMPSQEKLLAKEVERVMKSITGDRTRLTRHKIKGVRTWVVERWTGSRWIVA